MPKNLDFFFISASASAEMSMGQSLQANQAKKGCSYSGPLKERILEPVLAYISWEHAYDVKELKS